MNDAPTWFSAACPVIGMLHVPPLVGSPGWGGCFSTVRDRVLRDAEVLISGGLDGLMLENFGDAPFFPRRVPAHTVAQLTTLAGEVRRQFDVPLGINVLRNDGRSALAIALAVGASFIRVNVLCGARVTDQGVVQGIAHQLLRDRATLGGKQIRILADVDVKHSAPLAQRPIAEEAQELVHRGGADVLIVSGPATGVPPEMHVLEEVKTACPGAPVFLGSGITAENVAQFRAAADGILIGTALKQNGDSQAAVDPARVAKFINAAKASSK